VIDANARPVRHRYRLREAVDMTQPGSGIPLSPVQGADTTEGDAAPSFVVTSGVPLAGERPRLAAIVFTDIVGYSARMHSDEQGTIAAVHADFDTMRETVNKHGGEVLNTMGDGMMLAFDGAVAAMKFALEMQSGFAKRNAALPPGKGLQHRVGVHIGDVYRVAGGHMAGDGVNIAARLEPRAAQGGIAISQIVYDTVKGKVDMKAERMGPQKFKNIAEPVNVWRVSAEVPGAPVATVRHIEPPTPMSASPWLRRGIWAIVWIAGLLLFEDLVRDYKDMQSLGFSSLAEGFGNLVRAVMRLFGR
jgi:class 3 adenylate cyclase